MSNNNCIKFVNFINIIKNFCIKFKKKKVKSNTFENKDPNYRFGSGKIKSDDEKIEIVIESMEDIEKKEVTKESNCIRKRIENNDTDDAFEIIDESELE